ncbi:MAG TPA: PQQ-binding-like beta-propeller repeat protein, partial [Ktedonobacterales bacterium]|nr:PQQ-binding-like beta-propeller repeat protein [Ktedonobacterales bacterium]
MIAREISRVKRAATGRAPLVVLISLLLSGCGVTSVFNAPAPLASHVTIPYSVGDSGTTKAGLTALIGRDGNDAWHATTGQPSTNFQPIMVNGIIYTEGSSAQASSRTLVAVRASDGHILWKAPMPNPDFTIASDGVIVLAQAKADGLFALDAVTGALRWRLDQPATDPVYVKDGIAVATITDTQGQGAHLAVYQEADGTPLWQLIYADLAGINHTAVYTSGSGEVLAYAARTGKELWHSEIAGDLVGVNDRSVLVSGSRHVASLDAATGQTLWDAPIEFDGWQGIVQTPTTVYGTHNDSVIALDAATGNEEMAIAFSDYTVIQITEAQGVVFAMLAGAPGSSKPARVAALSLTSTKAQVYWQ